MFINFDEMPDTARLWIYQADKELTPDQQKVIQQKLDSFTTTWSSHGAALRAASKIFHHRFLVISVDEGLHAASGCSIDASVHQVREIGKDMGIDFFDRTKVAFIENESVFIEPLSQVKQKVSEGTIKGDTLTFNNLVTSKGEFEEKWVTKAQDSWLSRYF